MTPPIPHIYIYIYTGICRYLEDGLKEARIVFAVTHCSATCIQKALSTCCAKRAAEQFEHSIVDGNQRTMGPLWVCLWCIFMYIGNPSMYAGGKLHAMGLRWQQLVRSFAFTLSRQTSYVCYRMRSVLAPNVVAG